MFGLGMWELAVALVVALLVLGPEKLPGLARKLGKGVREFRRLASDFQMNLHAIDEDDDYGRPASQKPSEVSSSSPTSVPAKTQSSDHDVDDPVTTSPEESKKQE